MRFMVLVKANASSEAGVPPSTELLAEMGKFNEALVKAGVMLAGEGLHPTSKGTRIHISGKERRIVDGPFTETKELVAGFWIWRVNSKDEALAWAKRCPNPTGAEGVLELRQIYGPDDFSPSLTPELKAQEARLRAQVESRV